MKDTRRRQTVDPLQMSEPSGYQAWTAERKMAWLWHTLIEGTAHTPTSLPPLTLPFRTAPLTEAGIVLRRTELDKTLTRTSDLMEPGRPKLIHARGTVAMIAFTASEASPFTGLLAPQSSGVVGLLRLSLVAKVEGKAAYTPAMSLKFLIDQHPSADVLAMNHTVGQGRDFNVFSNSMTNDLSDTHSELRTAQRLMSKLFARISHQPRRMVSDHLVEQHTDGSRVDTPVAPDRLIFRATDVAKAVFHDRAGVDFRLVLSELAPTTMLYHVTGLVNGKETEVGSITMASSFVPSDGGDRLFFRHVHHSADRKLP